MKIGIIGGEERRSSSLMNYIMQSEQDANKIIRACEELIEAGYTFQTIIEQASKKCGVRVNNLTDTDKQKVIKRVEEIYHSNRARRDR